MKFYELVRGQYELEGMVENNDEGDWAARNDAEQVEKERDEFERKGKDLCQKLGQTMIELDQAAKDAVEMAKIVLVRGLCDERRWAETVIERYEGGKG
ncbi:MAG: hypothetical protein R3B95_11790 [Nitrospirales bacterium]|nr:hypothetical protein [Nitrospirales bacterium]